MAQGVDVATGTAKYTMTISRLTVDKLGVRLYDRVSAVLAELVANSYDADATEVTVSAPMGKYLAANEGGKVVDQGYVVEVSDDGIGMTPAGRTLLPPVPTRRLRTVLQEGTAGHDPVLQEHVRGSRAPTQRATLVLTLTRVRTRQHPASRGSENRLHKGNL